MPNYCSIVSCKHRGKSEVNQVGIVRHKFPICEHYKAKWEAFVREANHDPNFTANMSSRICSTHFTENCYIEGRKLKLKRHAVPSLADRFIPGTDVTNTIKTEVDKNDSGTDLTTGIVKIKVEVDAYDHLGTDLTNIITPDLNMHDSSDEVTHPCNQSLFPSEHEEPHSSHTAAKRTASSENKRFIPGTDVTNTIKTEVDMNDSRTDLTTGIVKIKVEGDAYDYLGTDLTNIITPDFDVHDSSDEVTHPCKPSLFRTEDEEPHSSRTADKRTASPENKIDPALITPPPRLRRTAYPGDLTPADFENPLERETNLSIMQSSLKKTRHRLVLTQRKLKRARREITYLKSLVQLEKSKIFVNDNKSVPSRL